MFKHFPVALLLFFAIVASLSSSAQYKADSSAVIALLQYDYKTVGNFDTVQHRLNCTPDYQLVEEGEVWDINQEIEYIGKLAMLKQYRLNEFVIKSVKLNGPAAYAVYELTSTISMQGYTRRYTWLETAIFRKVGKRWKIALIHSTLQR